MPRPATVLHMADVHLGSSVPAREELAFVRAVEAAITLDVDAVLIAGDLFDHARVAEDLLDWTADQLNRLERPVVVLPGNHDALHATSVYHRFGLEERCPGATLLDDVDGTWAEVPGTDVVVWGRAMVEHEPGFRPLGGLPERRADGWSVVAAHGLVLAPPVDPYRSSPIRDEEMDAVDWDYVALGHCHDYREVRQAPVPIIYPGATASSRSGEPGAVVVDFRPGVGACPRWLGLGA